ncbi:hypothetical protein RKLH11_4170 [Rhodobacteraceae bacterium KLH11]|nr:hypothetical protein RKLH11_4170 [Rhodobacteraceae bacterium KLH11]
MISNQEKIIMLKMRLLELTKCNEQRPHSGRCRCGENLCRPFEKRYTT